MIRTPRLLLRDWRDEDLAAWAELNADPAVRRWFPGLLTPSESDQSAERLQAGIAARGYGLWALEAPGIAPFIGMAGLQPVPFEAAFTPATELGWRLHPSFWGQGFATEAGRAALEHGFAHLRFPELVAYTVPANHPSRRVMQRLGMRHDPADDFDHPRIPPGSPVRRHVLYRVRACSP